MSKYPIFIELEGRRVVVVGAGAVAVRKTQTLLEAGAEVVLVAESIDDRLRGSKAILIESSYSKKHLHGAAMVIAATNNLQLNGQIYEDCRQMQILCNVVDQPELCDFFVPAIVKRGQLQVAVGTEGYCPAYSAHLRKKLEQIFTEKHGSFLEELEKIRKRVVKDLPGAPDRKMLLEKLVNDESFELFTNSGPEAWRERAEKTIKEFRP